MMNDTPQPSGSAGGPQRALQLAAGRRSRRLPSRDQHKPAPPQFTPRFLLWVLALYWKVVLPVGFVLAAGVGAYLLNSHVPLYHASGLIKIEDSQPYVAFRGASVGSTNQRFVNTQIELMRSPVVLREALSDKKVGAASHLSEVSDRLERLRSGLSVKQVGGSELYRVSYVSPSSQESSDVVNAVIQTYFDRQDDEKYRRVQRVLELLEKQRARRKIEVERLQQKVVELSREVTGKDPYNENVTTDFEKTVMSPLASLHQQLTEIEIAIDIQSAELQALEESQIVETSHAERSGSLDLQVDAHPNIRAIEQQIAEQQVALNERRAPLKAGHRDKIAERIANQIENLQQELTQTRIAVREAILALPKQQQRVTGKSPVQLKREELARLRIREATIRKRFETEKQNVSDSGGKGAELVFLKDELAREEKVFEMIAARRLALQTESKAPQRVEVIGPITASDKPIEAAPWKKLMVACALAMMAPYGLAVLREVSLQRVTDAEQLYETTGLRILGEISLFPTQRVVANPRQLPRRLRKDMFAFAESIDALRMSVTFATPSDPKASEESRVVAVTSAMSGEGKSSVSVGLAMSFANATRKRTLVIDGDMRSPSIRELLDIKQGPGLSEVLEGKAKLGTAICKVPGNDNLYVLQAGKCNGTPHHIAQPERIQRLIAAVRKNFETIVIDTPPVLGASESMLLCGPADTTAICTRLSVSGVRQVRMAEEKLHSAGVNVAGAVLNGVPASSYGYRYAYGYGYEENRPSSLQQIDHDPETQA